MADFAPAGSRMTSAQRFQLVDHGGFEPDDREVVRVSRVPDVAAARHAHIDLVHRGARLPGVSIAVDDVLPASRA